MTDGLFQQPEPDGFQNESPIRAFTDFKVEGNYAIGKGFRPSLTHLAAYLDAMQRKEGWRLVQILEAATAPTVVFIKTYAAPMYHITMGKPDGGHAGFLLGGNYGEPYDPDKREPSIHMLHKVANGLRQVTDAMIVTLGIHAKHGDTYVGHHEDISEWVDRINGHVSELEAEIGINPSAAEAMRKIDAAREIVEPIPSGIYWSPEAGNFYSTASHKGQGVDFYRQWADRRDEFPGDPRQEPEPTVFCDDGVTERDDPINPKHYAGRECADIGERLSANGYQILKYCWRLGKKDDPCQELGKAIWYLESETALLKCMGNIRFETRMTGIKPKFQESFLEERIIEQTQFTQNIARMLWAGYNGRRLQAIRECIEEHRFHLECGRGLAV